MFQKIRAESVGLRVWEWASGLGVLVSTLRPALTEPQHTGHDQGIGGEERDDGDADDLQATGCSGCRV